jgi:hypothetical protein
MLHPSAPRVEAEALFTAMRKTGDTAESIRDLIAVSLEDRKRLDEFAQSYPEEAPRIGLALHFRRRVSEEFERLILRE